MIRSLEPTDEAAGRAAAEPAPAAGLRNHRLSALAFVQNVPLRDLPGLLPSARRSGAVVRVPLSEGDAYVYSFGAVVFHNASEAAQKDFLATLSASVSGMEGQQPVAREEYQVREEPGCEPLVEGGVMLIDRFSNGRAGVVALTLAQSVTMEHYEGLAQRLADDTSAIVSTLRQRGTVRHRLRPLHRFMGQAISTRSEVLGALHLLDRPDATWDDPVFDRLYEDLRSEFDIGDRYEALELKLRGTQEALELILDVERDRRLFLLEAAIVALILVEIVLMLPDMLR